MDALTLVGNDTVVTFHYTLKDKAGETIDSSEGRAPLSYLHGYGNIVPGLEEALVGKAVGATLDVEVAAKDGYGERQEELMLSVPRSQGKLPEGVGVGHVVELGTADGQRVPARIVEINDEAIILDANHPLAGETLFFSIQVTAIRPATDTEKEHGHVHGEGGVHS